MEREKDLFPNLSAEMARANLSKPALAQIIGISLGAMYAKTSGKTEFTLGEMRDISSCLDTMTDQELTLDYLFKKREASNQDN